MFFLIEFFQISSLWKHGCGCVWLSWEEVLLTCGLKEKHTFDLGVSIQKDLELPSPVTDSHRACWTTVANALPGHLQTSFSGVSLLWTECKRSRMASLVIMVVFLENALWGSSHPREACFSQEIHQSLSEILEWAGSARKMLLNSSACRSPPLSTLGFRLPIYKTGL